MAYDVSVKEIAPERIVSARGRYRMAQLSLVVPRELARVVTALLAQKAQPVGGAVARYHGWNDDSVDVELGYPARGDFSSVEGGVAESMLPGWQGGLHGARGRLRPDSRGLQGGHGLR